MASSTRAPHAHAYPTRTPSTPGPQAVPMSADAANAYAMAMAMNAAAAGTPRTNSTGHRPHAHTYTAPPRTATAPVPMAAYQPDYALVSRVRSPASSAPWAPNAPPTSIDEIASLLKGGYHNRILLALNSSLPNEIDWALSTLCYISHVADHFHLLTIPGLVEVLLDMAEEYLGLDEIAIAFHRPVTGKLVAKPTVDDDSAAAGDGAQGDADVVMDDVEPAIPPSDQPVAASSTPPASANQNGSGAVDESGSVANTSEALPSEDQPAPADDATADQVMADPPSQAADQATKPDDDVPNDAEDEEVEDDEDEEDDDLVEYHLVGDLDPLADHLVSPHRAEQHVRALLILHTLRNSSFLPHNTTALLQHAPTLVSLVVRILHQRHVPHFVEPRHLVLDLIENLAPHLALSLRNKLDVVLVDTLHTIAVDATSDRGAIIAALTALARLATTERNEPMVREGLVRHPTTIARAIDLLALVDRDDVLVQAALEYLYQITLLSPETTAVVLDNLPRQALPVLVHCMRHRVPASKGIEPPPVPAVPSAPTLSREARRRAMDERIAKAAVITANVAAPTDDSKAALLALQWAKLHVYPDPQVGKVLKAQFLASYEQYLASHPAPPTLRTVPWPDAGTTATRLDVDPLVRLLMTVVPGSAVTPDQHVIGLALNPTPAAVLGPVVLDAPYPCAWAGCDHSATALGDLHTHVDTAHLATAHAAHGTACPISGCTWQVPTTLAAHADRAFRRHVLTHFPSTPSVATPSTPPATTDVPTSFAHQIAAECMADPVGVPYTAALVVRNLAHGVMAVPDAALDVGAETRPPANALEARMRGRDAAAALLAGVKDELVWMCAAYPRLARHLVPIVSEVF
ncbi:Chromatin structure-remodeling complex protein rsc9 [Allomyces javanicus]|nr:Chromatin structure-remodeling complex protein rsc9 [Allomyces javanicus]